MRYIVIAGVLAGLVLVARVAVCQGHDILSIASFIVHDLTLAALIIYAYDTAVMARIRKEHAEFSHPVLCAMYEMQTVGPKRGEWVDDVHDSQSLDHHAQGEALVPLPDTRSAGAVQW